MTPAATARHARAAEIRTLVEIEGKTFTQTADILGLTKGTIAGVTSRHGIQSPNLRGATKPLAVRLKPRPKARQEPPAPPPAPEAPIALPVAPVHAWLPLAGSSPVALEHHHEGTCHWPVTLDARTLFCALPVRLDPAGVRTYHYCPAHHAIGTKPFPVRNPDAKPQR